MSHIKLSVFLKLVHNSLTIAKSSFSKEKEQKKTKQAKYDCEKDK